GRAVDGQHHFISRRGWRIRHAKGRGNKTIGIAHPSDGDGESYGVSRAASEHRRAVECKSAHTNEGCIISKQVDREKIVFLSPAVVPYREFRVVAKLVVVSRINLDRVEGPRTCYGIGALRDTNALKK